MGQYFLMVCHTCRKRLSGVSASAKLGEYKANEGYKIELADFVIEHCGHSVELVGDERDSSYRPAVADAPDGWDLAMQYEPEPAMSHPCEMCGQGGAFFGTDPFMVEIHKDHAQRWLCRACREVRRDQI